MYFPSAHKNIFLDLAEQAPSLSKGLMRSDVIDTDAKRIESARIRLYVTGAFIILFYLFIALRLIDVMALTRIEGLMRPQTSQGTLTMNRGDIVDRNGVLLATNLVTASLYANPKLILNAEEAAQKIAKVLSQVSYDEILKKLVTAKSFAWIARNLTPEEQALVLSLGLPGLEFHREERRVYPQGPLLSHILGFTDIDNQGIGGVEHSFNDLLSKEKGSLTLSIDMRIQHILYDEIKKSIDQFSAQGGIGVVLNAKTGEVVAMVSLPDFDPNHPQLSNADSLFNKNTLGIYEMGSIFKIFTAAMALEKGTVNMKSGYDATAPLKVARFTITDFKGQKRWLSLPEIIMHSSNIGAAKMALDVGVKGQKEFMKKLGFFEASSIELPEVGRPLVPTEWRDINLMTISYGYGLSVSPLQMANGIAAMVNGGILHPTTLLKKEKTETAASERRVISESTSRETRKLMRLVATHGTGKKANVEGYLVGAKTGSANVRNARGGYNQNENLSALVAAFPMTDPEYVVLVMLDRPHATKDTYGYNTGGWTAAPAVGRVISRSASLLGIMPVNEDDPEVMQALHIPGFNLEAGSNPKSAPVGQNPTSREPGLRHARY